MNAYVEDSKLFFRTTARLVQEQMDKGELIQATMSFAFGMERVLKGILYDINPIYVLMNPDFNNSLKVFYSDKVIHENGELKKNVDADVITYRKSLLRAENVSGFVHENKTLLFYLSECRDIIAHNELSYLDMDKVNLLVKRDFYPIIESVCQYFGLNIRDVLSQQEIRLSDLSASLQTSIPEQVNFIINAHEKRWGLLKTKPGHVEDKEKVTHEIMLSSNKFLCECPACKNNAILYTKPETEFNKYLKEDILVGYFIKKIKCAYCKLEIDDYDKIQYLDGIYKYQDLIAESIPEQ